MLEIRREGPSEADAVEWLYDLAFAPGRRALSSYQLRDGVPPVDDLCCVAIEDGVVGGAIRFWPVAVGDGRAPALLLGPVAVHPTRQGEGIGALLIGETLETARRIGWRRALLVGDLAYYRRFGFFREHVLGVAFPPPTNPERVLGRELEEGGWAGVSGLVSKWRPDSDPLPGFDHS